VAQGARANAVNAHNKAAGGVRAYSTRVGFDPIGGMILPLPGRQEWDDRLQGIQAKRGAARQGQLATAQKKAIARWG
jgi:hypothetical protein